MSLEGLSPGKYNLTVTHNLTGMKEEIEVTVDSLRDKLFIFQVYPAQRSTVSYRNGDNKYNVVETDEKGRIAIFEKTGIKGDVVFTPEYTDLYS